ncbi:hypothetical protein BB559_000668 [Furculomyces boomerangus]|uniref:MTHFR SAM-binding regulatory domain-containing protein n=2 Tax=Harpellales TaxID=61421 RepID=A0A2T9Z4F7_9FUNG|nr:hypothetical protein BB559_000668 [Furculomyces boomerangus]PVZ97298.1 hypothetical protein BB558_006756 [Smittium angustum]
MKIIDKINKAEQEGRPYWSFEYFPPKTPQGVLNLYERIERMGKLNPIFIDITWRWGGKSKNLTQELCINSQTVYGLDANMHMTCTGTNINQVNEALKTSKRNNLQNILALRGDLISNIDTKLISKDISELTTSDYNEIMMKTNEFQISSQLVKYIRDEFGDYFCISVAGYPEGCTCPNDTDKDILVLKEKADAGADFVISQLFYDVGKYMQWIDKCKKSGINIPIIPGIMPIQNYNGFTKMSDLCNISIPDEIWTSLASCKEDDLAVKDFGIKYAIKMIKQLSSYGIKGFHFYTLNLERSTKLVLEGLQFVSVVAQPDISKELNLTKIQMFNRQEKQLPWPSTQNGKRSGENVRPIFWHNNASTYIERTNSWDEFPNGRWGNSNSPAFGEIIYGKYWRYSNTKSIELWGLPTTISDIQELFVKYCEGELTDLPWSDSPLQLESNEIKDQLTKLNRLGYLTINSQPSCNGVSSTNLVHGWGPKNGFVYKKAYIEFFIHPEKLQKLIKKLDEYNIENQESPTITYLAVSKHSDNLLTNFGKLQPNAVTWGVFPGCEIIQPTIVDPNAFIAWKEEAFEYWNLWSKVYSGTYPASHNLIQNIMNDWYLMNMVDNDYTRSSNFMYDLMSSL